jgi:ABC-type sugar transport system ATPase subunit
MPGAVVGGAEPAAREPLLSVRDLRKSFGPVRAVDGVSLDVYPREILSIIGDNGAGKSTFLSLLVGYHHPDAGQLSYRGRPISIASPRAARHRLRMEMVYQNLRLAPDLMVWENLFLGEEPRVFGLFTDRRLMRQRAAEVLAKLNTAVKPTDVVGRLSGGEQQAVAIGRSLLFDRDIVIMDEPTASISVAKVDEVLGLIRQLRDLGKTVLLVSHRLEDVIEVSDRIAVFYQGKIRRVLENRGLQVSDLVHEMF